MLVLGGFLLTALLVLTTGGGLGYNGQFVVDAFSGFNKLLILAGASWRWFCRWTSTGCKRLPGSNFRC